MRNGQLVRSGSFNWFGWSAGLVVQGAERQGWTTPNSISHGSTSPLSGSGSSTAGYRASESSDLFRGQMGAMGMSFSAPSTSTITGGKAG